MQFYGAYAKILSLLIALSFLCLYQMLHTTENNIFFLVDCIITHKNKVIQHQTLEHEESFVLENLNLGILKVKAESYA